MTHGKVLGWFAGISFVVSIVLGFAAWWQSDHLSGFGPEADQLAMIAGLGQWSTLFLQFAGVCLVGCLVVMGVIAELQAKTAVANEPVNPEAQPSE